MAGTASLQSRISAILLALMMLASRASKSSAPRWRTAFTKKVGVPATPASSAELTSWPTRAENVPRRRCLSKASPSSPSVVGVSPRGRAGRDRPGARRAGRASPRSGPARRPPPRPRPPAPRWDGRRPAAGDGRRSAAARRTGREAAAGPGRGVPQCGHSKSPYSSRVTGASTGPRIWSRSRIDRVGQIGQRPRRLGVGPPQPLARQSAHDVEEHDAEGRRDDRCGEDAELGLVEERGDVAELGDEQRHREADAGHGRGRDERRPADRERVTAETWPRRQPCPERDAERLADHQPEDDADDERGTQRAIDELGR